MIRTVIAIGAAAGIVCPPVALWASTIGAGMSVDAEAAPEPPQARTEAALPITTYAPIFPTPTADQPQPWTETDGPLHAPTPGQDSMGATDADAHPAAPSGRVQAAATPSPSPAVAPSPLPPLAPDPVPVPPADVAGAEPARPITAGVTDLVNAARAQASCLPITDDPELTDYAQQWAQTQAADRAMSHSSGPYAENVAVGYESAADVMAAWLDSPGHEANILTCAWTRHGIGAATVDGRTYWTQVFST